MQQIADAEWQRAIESLSGGKVVLVRVETDWAENVLRIPPEFPGRSIVGGLLQQETFVAQFVRAHALSVNYAGVEGVFHFILLNTAQQGDWEGMEDSLLAHELGHIWLHVNGYRSVEYENSCLATHASDIVQHVLIREETRRRGFDYMRFWMRNQDRWLAAQEQSEPQGALDRCQRLQLLSAWTDAAAGLTDAQWPSRQRYLKLVRARFPDLEPVAVQLQEVLAGSDLWDRSVYEWALAKIFKRLQDV